jgi:hypothetical protein
VVIRGLTHACFARFLFLRLLGGHASRVVHPYGWSLLTDWMGRDWNPPYHLLAVWPQEQDLEEGEKLKRTSRRYSRVILLLGVLRERTVAFWAVDCIQHAWNRLCRRCVKALAALDETRPCLRGHAVALATPSHNSNRMGALSHAEAVAFL